MPELGPYGSVRGARGNSRPYRDPTHKTDVPLALTNDSFWERNVLKLKN